MPEVQCSDVDLKVEFGDEILIQCQITNSPKNYEIYWEKINYNEEITELKISDIAQNKYSGSTKNYPHLTIQNVDEEDAAFYCCCMRYSSNRKESVFRSERVKLRVLNGKNIDYCKF